MGPDIFAFEFSDNDINDAQDTLLHSFRSSTSACLVCIETIKKNDPVRLVSLSNQFLVMSVFYFLVRTTLMCLSIGTPKNNKFSICSKWKIHYF